MFNRSIHLVQMEDGEKWISISALIDVLAEVNNEVQKIAKERKTWQATSAAGVVAEYTRDLRITLLSL